MKLSEFFRSVECYCTTCWPLEEQLADNMDRFADLVVSGATEANAAISDEAAAPAPNFFARVEDLNRTDNLEDIAEDLCKWPLNSCCLKVMALTEVVRDAGYWGPLAANIIKGPTPAKRRSRRKAGAR